MKKYKREETFRYEFKNDFTCRFKIVSIDGIKKDSNYSEGKLIDLSPNGLKLFSPLELPITKTFLYLEFTLNEAPIKITAEIIWKKHVGNGFQYGLLHESNKEDTRFLIDELKLFAKRN